MKKEQGKNGYFMQAQYRHEIKVKADDIFEAAHKAIDKLKKLELKDGFKEQRGSDLTMRITNNTELDKTEKYNYWQDVKAEIENQ